MPIAKQALVMMMTLAVASCDASDGDVTEAPSFDLLYSSETITPVPENVRFFERPKMLAEMRQDEGPMPEIVLLERDPWRMVLGSDSPRFALYDNGQAIYQTEDGFRTVRLSKAESLSIKKALSEANSAKLNGEYYAVGATDQPTSSLLLYGDPPVFLSVYGALDDPQVTSKLPAAVANAFDTIRDFKSARSEPWMPAQIEVMIWPYEYAPEPSIHWNEDWPDLTAPSTIQRGDSYSLFLPSSEMAALQSFLDQRNPKGAVEINGRKWAASYRIPFPRERLWMAPNPEAGDQSDEN